MLKNISQLKSVIEGKEGFFHCDQDTPLPVVKEMIFDFLKYVGQIEYSVKAQQAASIQEELLASRDKNHKDEECLGN